MVPIEVAVGVAEVEGAAAAVVVVVVAVVAADVAVAVVEVVAVVFVADVVGGRVAPGPSTRLAGVVNLPNLARQAVPVVEIGMPVAVTGVAPVDVAGIVCMVPAGCFASAVAAASVEVAVSAVVVASVASAVIAVSVALCALSLRGVVGEGSWKSRLGVTAVPKSSKYLFATVAVVSVCLQS